MRSIARTRARQLGATGVAALALVLATSALASGRMPEGYPGRGRIGIEVQSMTAELREFFGAPAEAGLLIVRVEPERPAERADLAVGDVVIAAAGEPLVRTHDLVAIVARAPAGVPLVLTVVRKGETRTIEVEPEGQPASAEALDAWHEHLRDFAPPAATTPSPDPGRSVVQPETQPAPAPAEPPAEPPAAGGPPAAPSVPAP